MQFVTKGPELNKWCYRFVCQKHYMRFRSPGWYEVEISVFKLLKYPLPGCYSTRDEYKGFRFFMQFWLPIRFGL